MQSKAILLCSGGLDSLVVAHMLKEKDVEVTALFFDYEQSNRILERQCSKKLCDKLGFEFMEIELSPMDWSESSIYCDSSKSSSQYIEMRNVIFLSYAMSIGEKLNIKDLYTGFIEPFENDMVYPDANAVFVDNFNKFAVSFGFKLRAPLSGMTKDEVIATAKKYGVTLRDFISCNVTIDGRACSKCDDCKTIAKYF